MWCSAGPTPPSLSPAGLWALLLPSAVVQLGSCAQPGPWRAFWGEVTPEPGLPSLSFPQRHHAGDRAASAPLCCGWCGLQGHLTTLQNRRLLQGPALPPVPLGGGRHLCPWCSLGRCVLPHRPGPAGASQPRRVRPMVLTSPSVPQPPCRLPTATRGRPARPLAQGCPSPRWLGRSGFLFAFSCVAAVG